MAGNLPSPQSGRPGVRCLSPLAATREDMASGPVVIVPPQHVRGPSNAHETAAALEMARHRVEAVSASGHVISGTPEVTTVTDAYAFAFDIDGVLIRGGKPIPGAIEALKVLNGDNEYGIKV